MITALRMNGIPDWRAYPRPLAAAGPAEQEDRVTLEGEPPAAHPVGRYLGNLHGYHHDLLRALRPAPVENAAYFGSGSDAETLLLIANPRHSWLFDRIPLWNVASAGMGGGHYGAYYAPARGASETADRLNRRLADGEIRPCAHGFFHPESEHQIDLGAKILGSLMAAGADNLRVEAVDERRTDIHFTFQHPDDPAPSARVLSFIWSPAEDGGGPWEESADKARATAPMDFLMTRACNCGYPTREPVFQALADGMTDHGLIFSDHRVERPDFEVPGRPERMPEGYVEWSGHGNSLQVYRKQAPLGVEGWLVA